MFKFIGLIISFGTLAVFILSYGQFMPLIDGSAALIMFGVFFGGAIFGYGNNIYNFIKLSRAERIKALDLFITLDFYNYLSKLTYYSAIIALLFSAVIFLANNQQADSFGTAISLSLLTCLYGIIISALIIQPLKHSVLYKNMNANEGTSAPKTNKK
ncbi:MAG: hypothetical protein HWE10_10540 [Gammaproteobacteria bacterium]|nr:hypothetical protein [Gammaproteobacteria bacterium]